MNYSKKPKKKQPLSEYREKPSKRKRLEIPRMVLKKFVGDPNLPKEMGHEIKIQDIDANEVGSYVVKGKKLPVFRIDVWVDWWTFEMQQFPSSRIGPSYYQAYDKETQKFYDLDKSTPDCFEKFYAESKRKSKV